MGEQPNDAHTIESGEPPARISGPVDPEPPVEPWTPRRQNGENKHLLVTLMRAWKIRSMNDVFRPGWDIHKA